MISERLPNTGLHVGPIAYAERPMRRDPAEITTDTDIYRALPSERAKVIEYALDAGVTLFHAAHEREAASLGASIRTLGVRDRILVSTTDGDALDRCPDTEIGAEEAILAAIRRKQKLLGTDYLDIFLLYDFRPEVHTPARLAGAVRALDTARKKGDIGRYGTTCYRAYDDLAKVIVSRQFTPSMVYSRYNYYDQRASQTLFPCCKSYGIDLLAAQTFSWLGDVPFVRFPNTWRYRNLTKNFYGFTAAQAHLYWVSRQEGISNLIISMQTEAQTVENIEAVQIEKTPQGLESLFDSFISAMTTTREGWLGLRKDEEWEYRVAADYRV